MLTLLVIWFHKISQSGWTNTGNTYHGDLTIAGHHNGTVESDSVSLNAEGINKESLNGEWFTTVTGSVQKIWFWNQIKFNNQ